MVEASSNFQVSLPSCKVYAVPSFAKSAECRCLRFYPPQLVSGRALPNPKWAVCTSATRKYATSALNSAGIDIPDVFVAAEDVKQGKPA